MPSPRSLWLLLTVAMFTSGSLLQAQRVGDRVLVSASGTTYVGQAAVGGVLGMGIGAIFRTERWASIPFGDKKIEYTPTIQPRVGPDGGLGLSFGARMRF